MHLTHAEGLRLPSPRSPVLTLVVLSAAMLLVFALDRGTGSSPVQHLYYLPIVLAGATFSMRGGIGTALVAILSYHLANPHLLTLRYEESDVLQIALFLVAGGVSARLTDGARRLQALAMTDDLTGLHNLRSFEVRLAAMVRTSRERHTPLALLVLDVDRLKSLNDAHGHLTGAEAVREVGHVIAARVPADAVACRYGGDEFVVAIPGCSGSQAARIAENLRRAVHDSAPVLAGVAFPAGTLSISVGMACHGFGPDSAGGTDPGPGETLFRAADAALYHAKNSGRNHVSVA